MLLVRLKMAGFTSPGEVAALLGNDLCGLPFLFFTTPKG